MPNMLTFCMFMASVAIMSCCCWRIPLLVSYAQNSDHKMFSSYSAAMCECGILPLFTFHLKEYIKNMWRYRKTVLQWYSIVLLLACTNTSKLHTWCHDNLDDTIETNFQCNFSIGVWWRSTDDMLLTGHVIYTTVWQQNYLYFLQNGLSEELMDVPLATQMAMYFQHDGALNSLMHHLN
jgi:hypothetical protein